MPHATGTPDRIVHQDGSTGGGGATAVTNFPTDYPDATAHARLTVIRDKIPDEEGVWDYVAGVSGTEIIPAGGRVLGIAVSVTAAGATVTINGGDAIPIPWITGTVQGVEICPRANLVAPTVVFFGTAAYLIEFIT